MRWKDLFISHAFFVYLLGFGTDKVARKFLNIKRNLENSSRPKFSGSLVNVLNARERIFRVSQEKVKLYKHQLINSSRLTNTWSDHTAIKREPRHVRRLSIKLPQAESGTSLEAQ